MSLVSFSTKFEGNPLILGAKSSFQLLSFHNISEMVGDYA